MPPTVPDDTLPLRFTTPADWVGRALSDPLALLNDHAHLEKKAAGNALELIGRWPGNEPPPTWVQTMTAVARDEIEHLGVVTKLLFRRGGAMTRVHRNRYASALRGLVRMGQGPRELMDRLFISALIEARSCERFELLGQHCPDAELAKLYRGLSASERGHYQVFITMAGLIASPDEVAARWSDILDAEAEIIQQQPQGPAMHSS